MALMTWSDGQLGHRPQRTNAVGCAPVSRGYVNETGGWVGATCEGKPPWSGHAHADVPPLRLDSLAQSFANDVLVEPLANLDGLLAESGGGSRRGHGRPRGARTTTGSL